MQTWAEHTMQDANDPAHETDGQSQRVLRADISGMHCVNCVVAVERHLKALPQVERVDVDYPPGKAIITHTGELDIPRTATRARAGGVWTVSCCFR